jgi:hypothetical protein
MTFCYILPVEHLFSVSNNNQPAFQGSICLGVVFYGGNIVVKSFCVPIALCPKIF